MFINNILSTKLNKYFIFTMYLVTKLLGWSETALYPQIRTIRQLKKNISHE